MGLFFCGCGSSMWEVELCAQVDGCAEKASGLDGLTFEHGEAGLFFQAGDLLVLASRCRQEGLADFKQGSGLYIVLLVKLYIDQVELRVEDTFLVVSRA